MACCVISLRPLMQIKACIIIFACITTSENGNTGHIKKVLFVGIHRVCA